jgi:hypothetical protein
MVEMKAEKKVVCLVDWLVDKSVADLAAKTVAMMVEMLVE